MLRQFKLLTVTALSGLLLSTAACSKSDNDNPPVDNTVRFSGTLSGANEVPANASTATGTISGSFNPGSKILTVSVNYAGITPVAGHIHKAAAGANGPVIFNFGVIIASTTFNFATTALDATQEADLRANQYYVNLHTAAFPGGEIRAQLIKQ
jgi:hypothetical protein